MPKSKFWTLKNILGRSKFVEKLQRCTKQLSSANGGFQISNADWDRIYVKAKKDKKTSKLPSGELSGRLSLAQGGMVALLGNGSDKQN